MSQTVDRCHYIIHRKPKSKIKQNLLQTFKSIESQVQDDTRDLPWLFKVRSTVTYTEDFDPEERLKAAFCFRIKEGEKMVSSNSWFEHYHSCVINRIITGDPYHPDLAELKYLKEKPLNFLIIGKPGLNTETVGLHIAELWGSVFISPSVAMSLTLPFTLDKKSEEKLKEGGQLPVDELLKAVDLMRSSVESKRQGYVLAGLPLSSQFSSKFCIEDQMEFIFKNSNRPDIIVYLTCPNTDVLLLNKEGTVENMQTKSFYHSLHLDDGEKVFSQNLGEQPAGLERDPTSSGMFLLEEFHNFINEEKTNFFIRTSKKLNEALLNDYVEKVSPILDRYVLQYDSQCVFKVDGRRTSVEIVETIRDKLNLLSLMPLCKPKPIFDLPLIDDGIDDTIKHQSWDSLLSYKELSTEVGFDDKDELNNENEQEDERENEEEHSEKEVNEETQLDETVSLLYQYKELDRKEAFEKLKSDYASHTGFNLHESDFNTLCPVEVHRGHICEGEIEYACAFAGKLFLLSSLQAVRKFIKYPTRYALAAPSSTRKISVLGPPMAGKSTLAYFLARFFGLQVISMRRVIEKVYQSSMRKIEGIIFKVYTEVLENLQRDEDEAWKKSEHERALKISDWIKIQLPLIRKRLEFPSFKADQFTSTPEHLEQEVLEKREETLVDQPLILPNTSFLDLLNSIKSDINTKETLDSKVDFDETLTQLGKRTYNSSDSSDILSKLKDEFLSRGLNCFDKIDECREFLMDPLKLAIYLPQNLRQPLCEAPSINYDDDRLNSNIDNMGIHTAFGFLRMDVGRLVNALEEEILEVEAENNLTLGLSTDLQLGGWILDNLPIHDSFWTELIARFLLPDNVICKIVDGNKVEVVKDQFLKVEPFKSLNSRYYVKSAGSPRSIQDSNPNRECQKINLLSQIIISNSLEMNTHCDWPSTKLKSTLSSIKDYIKTRKFLIPLASTPNFKGSSLNPFDCFNHEVNYLEVNFWTNQEFLTNYFQDITSSLTKPSQLGEKFGKNSSRRQAFQIEETNPEENFENVSETISSSLKLEHTESYFVNFNDDQHLNSKGSQDNSICYATTNEIVQSDQETIVEKDTSPLSDEYNLEPDNKHERITNYNEELANVIENECDSQRLVYAKEYITDQIHLKSSGNNMENPSIECLPRRNSQEIHSTKQANSLVESDKSNSDLSLSSSELDYDPQSHLKGHREEERLQSIRSGKYRQFNVLSKSGSSKIPEKSQEMEKYDHLGNVLDHEIISNLEEPFKASLDFLVKYKTVTPKVYGDELKIPEIGFKNDVELRFYQNIVTKKSSLLNAIKLLMKQDDELDKVSEYFQTQFNKQQHVESINGLPREGILLGNSSSIILVREKGEIRLPAVKESGEPVGPPKRDTLSSLPSTISSGNKIKPTGSQGFKDWYISDDVIFFMKQNSEFIMLNDDISEIHSEKYEGISQKPDDESRESVLSSHITDKKIFHSKEIYNSEQSSIMTSQVQSNKYLLPNITEENWEKFLTFVNYIYSCTSSPGGNLKQFEMNSFSEIESPNFIDNNHPQSSSTTLNNSSTSKEKSLREDSGSSSEFQVVYSIPSQEDIEIESPNSIDNNYPQSSSTTLNNSSTSKEKSLREDSGSSSEFQVVYSIPSQEDISYKNTAQILDAVSVFSKLEVNLPIPQNQFNTCLDMALNCLTQGKTIEEIYTFDHHICSDSNEKFTAKSLDTIFENDSSKKVHRCHSDEERKYTSENLTLSSSSTQEKHLNRYTSDFLRTVPRAILHLIDTKQKSLEVSEEHKIEERDVLSYHSIVNNNDNNVLSTDSNHSSLEKLTDLKKVDEIPSNESDIDACSLPSRSPTLNSINEMLESEIEELLKIYSRSTQLPVTFKLFLNSLTSSIRKWLSDWNNFRAVNSNELNNFNLIVQKFDPDGGKISDSLNNVISKLLSSHGPKAVKIIAEEENLLKVLTNDENEDAMNDFINNISLAIEVSLKLAGDTIITDVETTLPDGNSDIYPFCPVTYKEKGKLVTTSGNLSATFKDELFSFASESDQKQFLEFPDNFAAQPTSDYKLPPLNICVVSNVYCDINQHLARQIADHFNLRCVSFSREIKRLLLAKPLGLINENLSNLDTFDSGEIIFNGDGFQYVEKLNYLRNYLNLEGSLSDSDLKIIVDHFFESQTGITIHGFPFSVRDLKFMIQEKITPSVVIYIDIEKDKKKKLASFENKVRGQQVLNYGSRLRKLINLEHIKYLLWNSSRSKLFNIVLRQALKQRKDKKFSIERLSRTLSSSIIDSVLKQEVKMDLNSQGLEQEEVYELNKNQHAENIMVSPTIQSKRNKDKDYLLGKEKQLSDEVAIDSKNQGEVYKSEIGSTHSSTPNEYHEDKNVYYLPSDYEVKKDDYSTALSKNPSELMGMEPTDSITSREVTPSLYFNSEALSSKKSRKIALHFGAHNISEEFITNVYETFKNEYPPPKSCAKKLKPVNFEETIPSLRNYYSKEIDNINAMKDICLKYNIPFINHKTTRTLKNILEEIKCVTRWPNVFEKCYIVSHETASKLLNDGYYFFSKFGRWCPVGVCEKHLPIQPKYSEEIMRKLVFPVILKKYIYFIHTKSSLLKFISSPLKYIEQQPYLTVFPVKIAVIGAPKTGKSKVIDYIGRLYGLQVIRIDNAVGYVCSEMHWTDLARKIHECLKTGKLLLSELLVQALEAYLLSPECINRGWILDGFPLTRDDVMSMRKCNLVPHATICIETNTFWENTVLNKLHEDRTFMESMDDGLFSSEKLKRKEMNATESIFWERITEHKFDGEDELFYKYIPPVSSVKYLIWKWRQNITRHEEMMTAINENWGNILEISWKNNYLKMAKRTLDFLKTCLIAFQEYTLNLYQGLPASVFFLNVSEEEFEMHKSPFKECCPCCWYYSKVYHRCPSMKFRNMTPGLFQYGNHIYWICLEHTENFLSNTTLYLNNYCNLFQENYPQKLEMMGEKIIKDYFDLQYNGICITCYLKNLPTIVHKQGSPKFALSLKNEKIYLFCQESCMLSMLMKPQDYSTIKPLSSNENLTNFFTSNSQEFSTTKYFEQTVLTDLLCSALIRVTKTRPRIFEMNNTISSCTHLALILKAYSKKIDMKEAQFYNKMLVDFEDYSHTIHIICSFIDKLACSLNIANLVEKEGSEIQNNYFFDRLVPFLTSDKIKNPGKSFRS